MSTQPRGSEVYVTHATQWKLRRLAKASTADTLSTADAFAEWIISNWIAHNKPELDKLWLDRQSIDEQAEKACKPESV